jgi:microcystin-dependent protein
VVVAPGTASEEKMCVTLSGATLTVVDPDVASTSASANGRGVDDTTARSAIAGGSVVYPVFTATDADEANELTSTYSAQGHIVYQGASTFAGLGIGTAGQALKVNSGATAPEWGQIGTAGLADGGVTLAKLASALQAFLVPVGTITAYGGSTAPTGWLLCDGTSTTGYPTLAAMVGSTTPDLRGKFPMGKTASGTGSTLLGAGGSNTIAEANLPSHSHTINHDHPVKTSTGQSQSHNHTVTLNDPGHTHTISADLTGAIEEDAFVDLDVLYNVNNAQSTNSATTGITVSSVGNASHDHTHDVNLDAFSGTSGATGSGSDYFQPFVAVNYIIKHD